MNSENCDVLKKNTCNIDAGIFLENHIFSEPDTQLERKYCETGDLCEGFGRSENRDFSDSATITDYQSEDGVIYEDGYSTSNLSSSTCYTRSGTYVSDATVHYYPSRNSSQSSTSDVAEEVINWNEQLQRVKIDEKESKSILNDCKTNHDHSTGKIYPNATRVELFQQNPQLEESLSTIARKREGNVFVSGSLLRDLGPADGHIPKNVVCDVCIVSPTQPLIVITISSGETSSSRKYNDTVAKTIRRTVGDSDITLDLVNGVVSLCSLNAGELDERVSKLESDTYKEAFPKYLLMDNQKYRHVLAAILSTDVYKSEGSSSFEASRHVHNAWADEETLLTTKLRQLENTIRRMKEDEAISKREIDQLNCLLEEQRSEIECLQRNMLRERSISRYLADPGIYNEEGTSCISPSDDNHSATGPLQQFHDEGKMKYRRIFNIDLLFKDNFMQQDPGSLEKFDELRLKFIFKTHIKDNYSFGLPNIPGGDIIGPDITSSIIYMYKSVSLKSESKTIIWKEKRYKRSEPILSFYEYGKPKEDRKTEVSANYNDAQTNKNTEPCDSWVPIDNMRALTEHCLTRKLESAETVNFVGAPKNNESKLHYSWVMIGNLITRKRTLCSAKVPVSDEQIQRINGTEPCNTKVTVKGEDAQMKEVEPRNASVMVTDQDAPKIKESKTCDIREQVLRAQTAKEVTPCKDRVPAHYENARTTETESYTVPSNHIRAQKAKETKPCNVRAPVQNDDVHLETTQPSNGTVLEIYKHGQKAKETKPCKRSNTVTFDYAQHNIDTRFTFTVIYNEKSQGNKD